MSLIKVENLTFSYNSSYDKIFDKTSFQIDTDWKLGFIGRNGRGKTTFLNLLLGKYEYHGKIISSVKFDYFPYPITNKEQMTIEILMSICPLVNEWEFMKELSYLDVDSNILWQTFSTLSNGEQTKVLLAALFLNKDNFLLIDEPTNHLDSKARKIVSQYLKRKKGFILVCHDRDFLDECVDHIMSLNKANIEIQKGNFSSWFDNFKNQQEYEMTQNIKLKKDINRLKKAAAKTSTWSDKVEATKYGKGVLDRGYIGHKAAKMMQRSKNIEARQQQAIEQKSTLLKNVETADDLKLSPLNHHNNRLVSLKNVSIIYEGKTINNPLSFEIYQGQRIAIDGKNGSGKSSLLKLLINQPIEHTGTIYLASNLVISYVPQDTSNLQGTLTEFAKNNNIDESLFKAILRKMDFQRIQFEKEIQNYSAGQKKKVLIAKSLCQKAHLYIWDEPLNYIDIFSRIQIEQLIEKFSPTLLFIEHDLAFKKKIATDIIHI